MKTTSDKIKKALWETLSLILKTVLNIALCMGGLVVGIAGEIALGVLNFIFGILITLLSIMAAIGIFIWLLTL